MIDPRHTIESIVESGFPNLRINRDPEAGVRRVQPFDQAPLARTVLLKLKLGRRRAPGPRGHPIVTRRRTLPTPTDGQSPEALAQYDSVRLFVDRAQLAKPDFQVTKPIKEPSDITPPLRNAPAIPPIIANGSVRMTSNASLYEKATVDTLTRLYVRRYFFQRLGDLVRKARIARHCDRFLLKHLSTGEASWKKKYFICRYY